MDLENKNWYYVQAFGGTNTSTIKVGYTICFAESKNKAKEMSQKWAKNNGYDGSIHLYHKNYKREAKEMVEKGNYIESI